MLHPGRMKGHEVVPDVIDRFVVGGAEIPRHLFHYGRRYRVQRYALGESLGERAEQAPDLRIALIQSRGQRDELREHGPRHFTGMETQFGEFFREGHRMHAVRLRGPIHRSGRGGHDGKLVRDAHAVNGLRRMAGVHPIVWQIFPDCARMFHRALHFRVPLDVGRRPAPSGVGSTNPWTPWR